MKAKTNLKAGFLGSIALLIVIALAAPIHTHAITWCHDFVYYMISGQDSNKLSPDGLRNALMSRGYQWRATLTPEMPNQSSYLRNRDVLVFQTLDGSGLWWKDDHSGIVVDEYGCIDHFVQKYEHSGIPYTIPEAFMEWDNTLNDFLLRRGWTLQQIRDFRYNVPNPPPPPYAKANVQVWRHGEQVMSDWALGDARFISTIGGTFVPDPDPTWEANNPDWKLSSVDFNFSGGRRVTLYLATKRDTGGGFGTPSGWAGFVDPDKYDPATYQYGAWSGWLPAY